MLLMTPYLRWINFYSTLIRQGIMRKLYFLLGLLWGLDNRTEDNKLLVQKTYLDKTWEQYSNMEGPYHTRNVAARWLMNY